MGKVDLRHFASGEELARAAVGEWLSKLEKLGAGARYCVALSGGRIARVFFSAVAGMAKGRPSLMAAVHFFWGDERCVPPTDPESNFALARECLLDPLGVAGEQIHRVRGEKTPQVAAAEAEAELRRIATTEHATRNTSPGQPVLDMIFLGMGEDGHVASLFPGEAEAAMNSPAVYRAVMGPKPPPNRITLGYSAIVAARQVWVLVSGAGKEKALRESLAPNGQTPLARVIRLRRETKILTD